MTTARLVQVQLRGRKKLTYIRFDRIAGESEQLSLVDL